MLEWDELDLTIQARAAQLLTDPKNPDSVGSEAMAEMETEPVEVEQMGIDEARVGDGIGHIGVVQPMGTESSGP